MIERCTWCHMETQEILESFACAGVLHLVHTSHREELRRYCEFSQAARRRFFAAVGTSILFCIIAAILLIFNADTAARLVAAAGTVLCGLTLLRYPFATPETLALVGARRSIRLTRVSGVAVFVLGLILATSAVMR